MKNYNKNSQERLNHKGPMLNISNDKLPPELKDEARLDSLFSPLRSRTVNPKDWDSKLSSWKHLITLYCINNEVYSFSLNDLNKSFVRNGRPPTCLSAVIDELLKNGDIQYIDDFLKKSQNWSEWMKDMLVKRPVLWSYNALKRSLFTTKVNPEHIYVHLGVIQGESLKLVSTVPEKYRNKLMSFVEFLKVVNKDISHANEVNLLLHYLVLQKKIDVTKLENENEWESLLIKIGNDTVIPVSEVDVSVYVLEKQEKLFMKHVEELEEEIILCRKEAKSHLSRGHRQLAKTCLRKKREIDKRLMRKINALHNIQVLLERIRDVHTDVDVWQSYNQALSSLNTVFKETGLSEDAVENTIFKLGEIMEMHDDIQTSLGKPVIAEDDGDMEKELAELLKTEEKKENITNNDEIEKQLAELNIDSLPDIPTADVSLKEVSLN